MSDVMLSVEVVAKMKALSEGLKTGTADIKKFVDTSTPGLKGLQEMLNSLGINTSTSGVKGLTASITALTAENDKLKNSILNSKKEQAEANTKQAESKAIAQQNTAELIKQKTANAVLAGTIAANKIAQQEKTAADKEQVKILKELNAEANKKKPTQVSNSQTEVDAYKKAQQGSALYTSAINAERVARAQLNTEAAKQAIANGTLVNSTYANIAATQHQIEATGKNVLSKRQLAQMLAEEKLRQAQSTAEMKNNAREMLNAKGSLEQRRAALIRLNAVYDRLSVSERNSTYGNRMANIIRGVTDQIKALEVATGRAQRSVGGYAEGIAAFFKSISSNILSTLGPLALFTAAWVAAKEAFSHNIELSDNFTDIQRTAKLSGVEVDSLGAKLKKINTRTNLEGLLDIGFEGGRLGVQKGEILDFIQTVDKLAVVLKKELPGGAAAVSESLGKISIVYKIAEREGITLAQAMNKVASSQLELAHSGPVTVKYIQDFTLGLAGTAATAKLALPVIEAYGAVLGGAGQIASSAGLALTRVVNDLSIKREKYFAIAQLADATLTIETFTNLINTDTKAALDLFFKGLKAGNPVQTELADRLNTVGLKTGKVSNAVKILAENNELLAEKVKIASKAYEEGTSVSHNFELSNNSLAASFDKIKNSISGAFTDSAAQRGLASLLNAVTDNRTEGEKIAQVYLDMKHSSDELNAALSPLLDRYDELSSGTKLNAADQEELRDVTARIGVLLPGVTTKFDEYGNAISISRDRVRELTNAQKDLMLAMNRKAINTAGEDFAENQRKAAAQAKIVSDMAAAVGKKQGSQKMTNLDVQDQNDYLKILQGRAYESAKAIRDLGGALTDAQKKVIAYYEGIEKAKVKPKQKTEILGTGELVEETDLTRTTDVIKAEIKSLEAENKKLDIHSAAFKANVKKIIAAKNELKVANGGVIKAPTDPFNNLEKQVQDFQNKSNLITKVGVAKDLQEWEDKYNKIKAVIAKMPSGTRKDNAAAKLEGDYKTGKADIVSTNTADVLKALEKSQQAIDLAQLDGIAKEIQATKDKYKDILLLAEGNAAATLAIKKQEGDELTALTEGQAAKDINTSIRQIAEIAKAYRDHKAEMFVMGQTDGAFAVEVAENEKAKEELKNLFSDRLIDFEAYQSKMAALIAKGNELAIKPPVFDLEHFSKTARTAQQSINDVMTSFVDSGIASAFSSAFSSMGTAISEGSNVMQAAGEGLKSTLSELSASLGKEFVTLGTAKLAAALLMTPFGGKLAAQGAGLIALGAGLSLGGGMLNGKSGGKNSSGSGSSGPSYGVPHFAMGVENFGGGIALVGERGPELVNLPTGSDVIPNHKVMQSIAGGNVTQVMIPELRLSGQDLLVSFKRAEKNSNRR